MKHDARLKVPAMAALLIALLAGCATADSTGDPQTNGSNGPTPTPEPGPDPDPEPPVETNEVRLTWVETGGASRVTVEFPDGLPYFASFQVDADSGQFAIESVALDPTGAFAIDNDGCSGATIAPEQPCAITLVFDVDAVGVYETLLVVTPEGGSAASIPVLIEVVDDVVDPEPEIEDEEDAPSE